MKRLFCVKNKDGKVLTFMDGEEQYTSDKMYAKAYRDHLGGPNKGFHVSRGPDHLGKHGHSVPRMRRQPQRFTDLKED